MWKNKTGQREMTAYQIGVDEAGKGPVLGPLVAAAVRATPAELPHGIADSKQLSAGRRESLAATLRDSPAIDIGVGRVTTAEIDDPATDMNTLTVTAQVRALSHVASEDDHALVDAGDVSASRFERRVSEGVDEVAVTAIHGADEESQLVGAASIIAKVERDAAMTAIAADFEHDIGSGYPSDPTTRAFLASYVECHDELPACARESWATAEDVLQAAEQSSLAEF